MERYHPRAGLWCLIVALPTWFVFLLNGMLGFFPAVIFAEGGVGQKFHFWLFIQDKLGLFGGSPDPVWSDAGTMTSQEWILLILALGTTVGAAYCLRQRPEFGAIQRNDEFSERESLEVGAVGIGSSGGGDAHTKSIVESVIGETETLDQSVVSAALGEMGVIAAANAAAEEEQEEDDDDDPIMDSRFTTTIPDDETLEMVSKYTEDVEDESEDDVGWGVWDPQTESESVPESEAETEVVGKRELPAIPELFQEPEAETLAPIEVELEPELPTIEAPPANIAERIGSLATSAADTTVNVTKDIVSSTISGARDMVSKAGEITEKITDKVRKKSTKGVMPVRPAGLPAMAEWDPYQGAWTIMGRPVKVAEKPVPETDAPSWTQQSLEIDLPPETPVVVDDEPNEPRRKTPFIPELP